MANYIQTQLKAGIRIFYTIQKEVISMKNSQTVKTGAAFKKPGRKRCYNPPWLLRAVLLQQLCCFAWLLITT